MILGVGKVYISENPKSNLGVGKMVFEEPILRGGTSRTVFLGDFHRLGANEALQILEGAGSQTQRRIIDLGNYAMSFPEKREDIAQALQEYCNGDCDKKCKRAASRVVSCILATIMLEALG